MALVKQIRNSGTAYGWGAVTMHWLVALAVAGMYPLGLYIDSLGYYDPLYRTVPFIHKSIGLILFALVLIRIGWRFMNVTPDPLPGYSTLVRVSAHLAHVALYALLLTVLVSGYLISTADGRGISVFGWFEVPALPELIQDQEDVAGDIHFYAATSLVGLAVLHALAALKHHFFDKDQTLNRMLGMKEKTK